jgi:hypothetical protein
MKRRSDIEKRIIITKSIMMKRISKKKILKEIKVNTKNPTKSLRTIEK